MDVNLHQHRVGAFFQVNENLVNWVNQQLFVNYAYFQAEGLTISSGTIESTVKQILLNPRQRSWFSLLILNHLKLRTILGVFRPSPL